MTDVSVDLRSPDTGMWVHIISGDPLLSRATEMYRQALAEAGVDGASHAIPPQRPDGRRSFHVAVDASGSPLGVLQASIGTLDQLSLGPMMEPGKRLGGVICECPAISVAPGHEDQGVTELLYRSVYCFARRQGAESLAAIVDPMTLDLFRDEYGILFRALGPVSRHMGFDQIAVGERLSVLETSLYALRPDFYDFLSEPLTPEERSMFGLRPTAASIT
ncbi:MAG: hypothetical protein KDB24_15435 [Microthrixaceae bacterium]|nr:hypothetical protein [Microthrixaceae bacterium]